VNRRRALAAASLGAALVAVWAAGSGTPGSSATSNRGVQSVVLSVTFPAVIALTIAVLIALVLGLFRRRSFEGEAEEDAKPPSRWVIALATLLAFAPIAFILILLLTTHRHRPVPTLVPGSADRSRVLGPRTRPVHLDTGIVTGTSLFLALTATLFLTRQRLLRLVLRPRPLAALPPAHELQPLGVRAGAPSSPSPAGLGTEPWVDPRAEPDPRRAILLAYQRFVAVMARTGLARNEAETALEYCGRLSRAPVFSRAAVRQASVGLTSLFSAARYNPEPPSPGDREAAIDCLVVIERELAERAVGAPA
jgi:hypothetical protein